MNVEVMIGVNRDAQCADTQQSYKVRSTSFLVLGTKRNITRPLFSMSNTQKNLFLLSLSISTKQIRHTF